MYERLIEKLRANPQSYYLIKDEEEFKRIYNYFTEEEKFSLKYHINRPALSYSENLNRLSTYNRGIFQDHVELDLEEESLKDLEPLFKQSKLSKDKKILILPEGKWELIENKLVCHE